jgi:hypothetical protein
MANPSEPFRPRKMRASLAAPPTALEKENVSDRRKRSQSMGGPGLAAQLVNVELSPRKKARRSLVSHALLGLKMILIPLAPSRYPVARSSSRAIRPLPTLTNPPNRRQTLPPLILRTTRRDPSFPMRMRRLRPTLKGARVSAEGSALHRRHTCGQSIDAASVFNFASDFNFVSKRV